MRKKHVRRRAICRLRKRKLQLLPTERAKAGAFAYREAKAGAFDYEVLSRLRSVLANNSAQRRNNKSRINNGTSKHPQHPQPGRGSGEYSA